ncbi:hypothetical protein H0H93_010257 [Arthromyces matolae]|nr:hypothetical protein H0H93_010257 [Arthromyces matolae]
MASKYQQLPPETRLQIASYCTPPTLSALALVAPEIRPEAEEILYSSIAVTARHFNSLVLVFETLEGNPQKAGLVELLEVDAMNSRGDGSVETNKSYIAGQALLRLLPNLISLRDLRLKFAYFGDKGLVKESKLVLQATQRNMGVKLHTLFCNNWFDNEHLLENQGHLQALGVYGWDSKLQGPLLKFLKHVRQHSILNPVVFSLGDIVMPLNPLNRIALFPAFQPSPMDGTLFRTLRTTIDLNRETYRPIGGEEYLPWDCESVGELLLFFESLEDINYVSGYIWDAAQCFQNLQLLVLYVRLCPQLLFAGFTTPPSSAAIQDLENMTTILSPLRHIQQLYLWSYEEEEEEIVQKYSEFVIDDSTKIVYAHKWEEIQYLTRRNSCQLPQKGPHAASPDKKGHTNPSSRPRNIKNNISAKIETEQHTNQSIEQASHQKGTHAQVGATNMVESHPATTPIHLQRMGGKTTVKKAPKTPKSKDAKSDGRKTCLDGEKVKVKTGKVMRFQSEDDVAVSREFEKSMRSRFRKQFKPVLLQFEKIGQEMLVRSMRGNALRHTSRPNAVSPRLTRPAATNAAFKQPPPTEVPRASSSQFSGRTFESAPISAQSKKAITHKVMSDVQAATLDVGLAGKDLIVQAKTGTGKTLAFLLPTIERLIKSPRRHDGISVLVLSPTRELAFQIQKEAQTLLQYHEGMSVGCIIGGVNPNSTINTILKKKARAGASGHGIIILDPVEAPFLGSKDMESLRDRITPSYIPPASASSSSSVPDSFTITIKGREIQIPKSDTPLDEIRTSNDEVSTALLGVKRSIKSLAYRAWLGYYRTSTKITKWSPEQMVAVGNAYVQDALGWPRDEKPPPLSRMLVGKMGLKNVRGLNVVANDAIANLDEE